MKREIRRNEKVCEILENMEKVVIGKKEVLELAIITLLAEGNLLLEDVPGVGKTTLANTLAKTVGCDFNRIQFTPDTLPGDVLGVSIYRMQQEIFEYIPGAIMSNIVLADEINRTSPKTQASLLEAMEEKQVTVDGVTHLLPKPFMLIATQNPIDYLGTYHLPEAQLDRFFMRLSIGYPAHEEELSMIGSYLGKRDWKQVDAVIGEEEILRMQEEVKTVSMQEDIIVYALKMVEMTRQNEHLLLGASPRATMALMRGAQSAAYCQGRDYVIPDDIRKIAKYVLCHRLVLSPEAKAAKMSPEKILDSIMSKVHVPV